MATEEILEALKVIAREKSVDRQLLVETLRLGLESAANKKFASAAAVDVRFDELSGEIKIRVHKKVVHVAINLEGEIDLEEALKLDKHARLGSTVPVEVPIHELGRAAIQAAKQVLVQRVREAERENVFNEYADKTDQVVSGSVSQVDRGSVIVKIGRTEAIIPHREVINRDRFKIGDPVRALLIEVDKSQRGPQLILSRTNPEFVRRLFENEVPEIFERVVEIRDIAREPGSRTKISVVSHDDRVDPVGACVGMKGARVQAIVRELGGERIDIVPWSPDPKIFVSRALSPARVVNVIVHEEERRVTVVVPDDQLSMAIGTRGQNARLAHKLTGYAIDLRSQSQMQATGDTDGAPDVELEELEKELGPRTVERLMKAGKETLQDVMRTSVDELMAIPGIGEKTASRLLSLGGQILEERLAKGATPSEADGSEAEADSESALDSDASESESDSESALDSDASGSGSDSAEDDLEQEGDDEEAEDSPEETEQAPEAKDSEEDSTEDSEDESDDDSEFESTDEDEETPEGSDENGARHSGSPVRPPASETTAQD